MDPALPTRRMRVPVLELLRARVPAGIERGLHRRQILRLDVAQQLHAPMRTARVDTQQLSALRRENALIGRRVPLPRADARHGLCEAQALFARGELTVRAGLLEGGPYDIGHTFGELDIRGGPVARFRRHDREQRNRMTAA